MGTTTSCQQCRCVDEYPASNRGLEKSGRYLYDASREEEIISSGDRRRPLRHTSIHGAIPVLAQKPAHSDLKRKRAQRGIDEENYLQFRFRSGDNFGLRLSETKTEVMGQIVATLLVAVNVDADSAFAQTEDGLPGVRPGDVIVEANGRRGTAGEVRSILEQAVESEEDSHISIVVRPRPSSFYVEMPREGPLSDKLGVRAVIDKANHGCILVTAVRKQGLVPDWNAKHGSLQICAGDLVAEVNGISQDADAMCKEMQAHRKSTLLRLRIVTSWSANFHRIARRQRSRPAVPKEPSEPRTPQFAARSMVPCSAQVAERECRHSKSGPIAQKLQLEGGQLSLESARLRRSEDDQKIAVSPQHGVTLHPFMGSSAWPHEVDNFACDDKLTMSTLLVEHVASEAGTDSDTDSECEIEIYFETDTESEDEEEYVSPRRRAGSRSLYSAPWEDDIRASFALSRTCSANVHGDASSDVSTCFPSSGIHTPALVSDCPSGARTPIEHDA